MKFGGSNSKFYQENSNILKCLDIYKDINYMKLLTGGDINSNVSNSRRE
jgi:hypothetical protein